MELTTILSLLGVAASIIFAWMRHIQYKKISEQLDEIKREQKNVVPEARGLIDRSHTFLDFLERELNLNNPEIPKRYASINHDIYLVLGKLSLPVAEFIIKKAVGRGEKDLWKNTFGLEHRRDL